MALECDRLAEHAVAETRRHAFWDYDADQPHRIPRHLKSRTAWPTSKEYLTTALTACACAPALLWRFLNIKPPAERPKLKSFVGLSVSFQPQYNGAILDMVDDLGVEELLIRIPTWELDRLDEYRQFAEQFRAKKLLICVLQCRQSVLDPESWRTALGRVFDAFQDLSTNYQIGAAANRTKWGCANSAEYLKLMEIAEEVRADFPQARLLGPSVIDFEPLVFIRCLMNARAFHLDRVSALLYVNRRGSPQNKQYLLFDLANKIRLIAAIASLSTRCDPRLWITEVNWPLLNTHPYTPNSGRPETTVDEETQAQYLRDYYQIAYDTGFVEKVYWWQLVAPGYGLVDSREGRLRQRPSYYVFKQMIAAGFQTKPVKGLVHHVTTVIVWLSDSIGTDVLLFLEFF